MRAERLLAMMLLLESKGHMKAEELAERLGVSERTIYRDVEALCQAGVPVYTQTGTHGGVFLDEGYRLSLNGLNMAEVQALFALPAGGPLDDLGLTAGHETILLKLLSALPQLQQHEAMRLRQRLHIDPTDWFRHAEPTEWLTDIQQAVWADREIEIVYLRKDGQRSRRRVQPFGLVAKSSIWYLVARQLDGSWRSFRVSRVEEVNITETTFDRPADFDLATHWSKTTAEFESSFDQPTTPCLVRCRLRRDYLWLFSSSFSGQMDILTDPTDDWVVIEVETHWPVAVMLRMGDLVEVLSPDWLRAELREAALGIAAKYAEQTDAQAG